MSTTTTSNSNTSSSPTSSTATPSSSSTTTSDAMDIDPIDDGPKIMIKTTGLQQQQSHLDSTSKVLPSLPSSTNTTTGTNTLTSSSTTTNTTIPFINEEEVKIYIDKLRSDDISQRILASYRIDSIALALGTERTRTELLPFITDGIDDDDEVLLGIATSIGRINIITMLGGYQYITILLQPIELLLSIEEITVRDTTILSTHNILQQLIHTTNDSNTENDNNTTSDKDNDNDELRIEALYEYINMIGRLANKEWFTARISATILIASSLFYCNLPTIELQKQYLNIYIQQLCHDTTPMVRRIAAQQLKYMIYNIVKVFNRIDIFGPNGIMISLCIPIYEDIANSDQPDSVRLQTTENCVAFGHVMTELLTQSQSNDTNDNSNNNNNNTNQLTDHEIVLLQRILPLIVATIDDRSWRVRWTAASKFALIIQAYNTLPNTMDILISAYEKLLQDPEAEVRTAATFNLAQVAQCNHQKVYILPSSTTTQILNRSDTTNTTTMTTNTTNNNNNTNNNNSGGGVHHLAIASMAGTTSTTNAHDSIQQNRVTVAERLVKRITTLTEDDSEHVRAALAMVATGLAPILGKDATITYLVPPVLLLLRDAASEVRLNLISSLSALNEVIGVDLLSQSLLPAILDLAQDGKWRIRLAIIQHIPLLAEQLGREFFTERLTPLCVGWLGDDIASIRIAAAHNLKELTKLFGTEWAVENLLPPIIQIREHESYLRRLTALKAFSMIATAMDAESASLELLPLILDMATDVVPNIRFNVARELRDVAILCGVHSYELLILPILNMLLEDDDRDVRFYAEQTLNSLDEEFATIQTK